MIISLTRRLQRFALDGYALLLIAVFITVLGSRLWLIESYGNDVPVGDQWDAEAATVYKPMLEHGVGAVDWFAAQNEHRVVLTKLTSAAMLLVNGQWDPLLQITWGAFCAALIAALICISAIKLMPDNRAIGLVFGLALIGLTMPYGWENTLAGFQSAFYYLMLLALAMVHLCAYRGLLTTRRLLLISALGVLSLGTLASGALACLAAACALGARLTFARQTDTWLVAGLAALLIGLALIGFGTTPQVAGHAILHPHTAAQFIKAFNIVLGWPTKLGCLIWLPFAIWCIQATRRRKISLPGVFLVGLATFIVLNAAATALARGATIQDAFHLSPRYIDLVWYGWLVNLIAALLLIQGANDDRSTVNRSVLVLMFFFGAAFVLENAGWNSLIYAAQRGAEDQAKSVSAREYVATGEPARLRDKPSGQIAYPDANLLMQWLDDRTLRPLLPPTIRQGILARSGGTEFESLSSHGVLRAGSPPDNPAAPAPYVGDYYGTWGDDGNRHTAKFISAPIEAQGYKVRVFVSGYLGRPGLSLYLEDLVSGTRVGVVPKRIAAGTWTSVTAKIPGPVYRLVAEDTAIGEDGWFAFTDPVEAGRLRGLVEWLIRNGKGMTIFGVTLFLASVLVQFSMPHSRKNKGIQV